MNVRRLSRKTIFSSLWAGIVYAADRLPVLDVPVCVWRAAIRFARRRCPCGNYNMIREQPQAVICRLRTPFRYRDA